MYDILNITSDISFDNSLDQFQFHSHQPYAGNTYNQSDEIRIPIQQQDIYTLPSMSFIYMEGRVLKNDGTTGSTAKMTNNAFAFMFDEIRYELNGVEIDRVRNPGIAATLKGYVSFSINRLKGLENAGWIQPSDSETLDIDKDGVFSVCLPLDILLGFCEDYRKILINLKQELVLIRSSTDLNSVKASNDVQIKLDKVVWRVPHVRVSDHQRLRLLKMVNKNQTVRMAFRSWDLYEYPALPSAQQESWAVKTSANLEKPRYVIIAFQTDRNRNVGKDSSLFDSCTLKNVKLNLNSEQYPYDDLNLDFEHGKVALLYEMYKEFQTSYYGEWHSQPLLSRSDFENLVPLVVIDCSKQSEAINSSTIDIRLQLETSANFPPKTKAYCLILHDRIVEYEIGSGLVRKLY